MNKWEKMNYTITELKARNGVGESQSPILLKKTNKPTTISGYAHLAAKRVRSGAKFINEHPAETARTVLGIASLAATLAGANAVGEALRLSANTTQYRSYTSSPSSVTEIEEWRM